MVAVRKPKTTKAARRELPVTDPDLDAPIGTRVDGLERVGDRWLDPRSAKEAKRADRETGAKRRLLKSVVPVPKPKPKPTRGSIARVETKALAKRSLELDLQEALDLASDADAANTKRAYASDRADWKAYAEANGLQVFPISGEALCAYIGNMRSRGLKLSTIRRRCSALSSMHRGQFDADNEPIPSPTDDLKVRTVLKGLARRKRTSNQKRPMTGAMIREARANLSERDWIIVAAGFVTGVRRSELVALTWGDVEQFPEGLVIHIRFSKTDQEGEGHAVAIPFSADATFCVARALLRLRPPAGTKGVKQAKLFAVSDRTVARVVKRLAAIVGEDPHEYAGHSLRAGLATNASRRQVAFQASMAATGHKSPTVAQRYVRLGALTNPTFQAAVDAIAQGSS